MKTQASVNTDGIEEYILTESDYEYIEDMALFFGITRDEAYRRFLTGNIDGLTDDIDDEPEDDE